MSDPTTSAVPTRQQGSNEDENKIAGSEPTSVPSDEDGGPPHFDEIATASLVISGKETPLKDFTVLEESSNSHSDSSKTLAKDLYVQPSKPSSSRQRLTTTTTGSVSKSEPATDIHLLQRLAGPSVGKAGLARDQTEITRLIARASEGSKYYENEKRKSEEVEKKIEGLLKLLGSQRAMADIPRLEATADKIIAELESTRDLSQTIVHVDMDSFYASIEVLNDPSLASKPFGVGSNNGVLSTASYSARAFGVRSGMATYIAKALCPGLIVVHMDWERIGAASEAVMDILREYAGDPDGTEEGTGMDIAGVDEAYVNITGYCRAHEIGAEECVEKIRAQIFEETKLTASAGIAPNKMLAKICSERNKPNGQYALSFDPEVIKEFMRTLSIRRIPGIGRVTERLLEAVDIKTCGDIYTHRATLSLLDKHLHMREKLAVYLGLGSTRVKPWPREARKSVGAERTFRAIDDPAKIQEKLELVARELETDLERTGFAGHTVTLKLKLDTFEARSRAKSARKPVRKYEELLTIGQELLAHELPLKLRLLGLRVTNLKDLRAPETGIKRFFGNAQEAEIRPAKRRKLNDETGKGPTNEEPIYIIDDDSENEGDARPNVKRAATATPEKPRTQAPADAELAPRASSHEPMPSQEFFATVDDRPLTKRKRQPQVAHGDDDSSGTGAVARVTTNKSNEQHVCPICAKTLQTDNAGLNAHIDWCLSRSAILEASASASSSSDAAKALMQAKKGTGGKKTAPTATNPKPNSSKGQSKGGKSDIRFAWKVL